jgi:hypothetical protein
VFHTFGLGKFTTRSLIIYVFQQALGYSGYIPCMGREGKGRASHIAVGEFHGKSHFGENRESERINDTEL